MARTLAAHSYCPLLLSHMSPSPSRPSARCASGARSPDAPTLPCSGTSGRQSALNASTSARSVSSDMPEKPLASVCTQRAVSALSFSLQMLNQMHTRTYVDLRCEEHSCSLETQRTAHASSKTQVRLHTTTEKMEQLL